MEITVTRSSSRVLLDSMIIARELIWANWW